MKILYHHRTLGDGAEGIHIREMVKAFRQLGHDVRVIGPVGEAATERGRRSRMLERLKRSIPAVLYEILEILYTAYCFWRTARAIRSFQPDFIYDRYITFNAGTILASRVFQTPVCLEVNAPLAMERAVEPDERLTLKRLASRMESWICSHSTHTIVVSTPLKTYLESIGIPAGKCIVMPNGVDPERFAPRKMDPVPRTDLAIPEESIVIGFTGILRPWHGLELLLEAFAGILKDGAPALLLIVGDGPHRGTLEERINALGIAGSVRITGRVPHDDVPTYVSLFDVAVAPRATFYASPMKVIEYMALGKAVVVPATPNFLDIIDAQVNGIVFEEGSAHALEEALRSLCRQPDLRHQLGVRAREKVERTLNWRWNAQAVCKLVSSKIEPDQ
jgi:glycosyltransferase involved in cell wall biosynthesis